MTLKTAIRPAITMAEIYGPRHVYAPRAHPRRSDLITTDGILLDGLTGNQLSVLGDMAAVASLGVITPLARELADEAGLEWTTDIHPFASEAESVGVPRALARSGMKIVINHVYPDGELPPGATWVDQSLLSHLNNKGNLGELVPSANAPWRRVVRRAAITEGSLRLPTPVVLKGVTSDSAGSGGAVRICLTPADVASAPAWMARCEHVVVEEYLSIVRSPCVNFAVMTDGEVRYLGLADQHLTPDGSYKGNWMYPGDALPAGAIAALSSVVARGAAMGYRGIVGMDVVVTPDDRVVVIDLNFRLNGSTSGILLRESIERATGATVFRQRSFAADDGFDHLTTVARDFIRRGRLIPTNLYDPRAAGHRGPGVPARMTGLLLADSRADAMALEAELAAHAIL
jgi:hypothetical protein